VALKLVIEVDGHDHQTDEGLQHDQRRDQFLAQSGYHVLRIPGYEVLRDAAGVRRQIEAAIDNRIE
jgi:very-short-patch-repair endonuclease